MLKGLSMPFSGVASLVLGILFLVVGYQVITGINANSLEPNVNEIEAALGSFGTQEVALGEKGDAEKQFRGLVAFNMLSAANCRLPVATFNHLKAKEDPSFNGDREGSKEESIMVEYLELQHFEELKKSSFDPVCFGANSIDIPLLSTVDNTLDILNPMRGKSSENSNDMEGRFGRVFFEVKEEFKLNDESFDVDSKHGEILMSTNLKPIFDSPSHPDFWHGDRYAVFVPDGIQGSWGDAAHHEIYSDDSETHYSEQAPTLSALDTSPLSPAPNGESRAIEEGDSHGDYSTGWMDGPGEQLYHYRIRMSNVPMILAPGFDPQSYQADPGSTSNERRFEKTVEKSTYVFCEGAKGYVQSNAKHIDNGGEATGDLSRKENAVFPRVRITSGAESCLESSSYSGYNNYLGYNVDGKTCDLDKSIGDSRRQEQLNVGGNQVDAVCGLVNTDINLPPYEYLNKQPTYEIGWLSDQCVSKESIGDGASFVNGLHTVEDGNDHLENEDGRANVIWENINKDSGTIVIEFKPEKGLLEESAPGFVGIAANGNSERIAEINYKGKSGVGNIDYSLLVHPKIGGALGVDSNTITNNGQKWRIVIDIETTKIELKPESGKTLTSDISSLYSVSWDYSGIDDLNSLRLILADEGQTELSETGDVKIELLDSWSIDNRNPEAAC